jgi:histidinol phosphatase-like PHP family hydrolase
MKAPKIAINYYELGPEATMRDMLLSVRADEAIHRDVNHRFSELSPYADYSEEMVSLFQEDKKIFRIQTQDKKE